MFADHPKLRDLKKVIKCLNFGLLANILECLINLNCTRFWKSEQALFDSLQQKRIKYVLSKLMLFHPNEKIQK